MGPPIFIGEIVVEMRLLGEWPASMGPPIFIGGNPWWKCDCSGRVGRFTGPPIFIGGNGGGAGGG